MEQGMKAWLGERKSGRSQWLSPVPLPLFSEHAFSLGSSPLLLLYMTFRSSGHRLSRK